MIRINSIQTLISIQINSPLSKSTRIHTQSMNVVLYFICVYYQLGVLHVYVFDDDDVSLFPPTVNGVCSWTMRRMCHNFLFGGWTFVRTSHHRALCFFTAAATALRWWHFVFVWHGQNLFRSLLTIFREISLFSSFVHICMCYHSIFGYLAFNFGWQIFGSSAHHFNSFITYFKNT